MPIPNEALAIRIGTNGDVHKILQLLNERDRLRTALLVAKANLDAGTYTEAAEDIIAGALYND